SWGRCLRSRKPKENQKAKGKGQKAKVPRLAECALIEMVVAANDSGRAAQPRLWHFCLLLFALCLLISFSPRPQHCSFTISPDPMIREPQLRPNLHTRHVAFDAPFRPHRTAMAHGRMAARAALVIIRRHPAQRRMRRMTAQTG